MVEMNTAQADELKEKLAQMSPEELREFQKKQCVFCQIIGGRVASKKVYSDDKCTAILDINPANPGHIVLLPNEHYSIMPLVPPEILQHLFKVAKALAHASLKALEAQGTNIFVANGIAAGQKAQHFMLHIIPRKEGDDLKLNIPERAVKDSDLKQIMDRLKPAVLKSLGAGTEGKEEKPEEKKEEAQPEETKEEPQKKEEEKAEEENEVEEIKEALGEEEEAPKVVDVEETEEPEEKEEAPVDIEDEVKAALGASKPEKKSKKKKAKKKSKKKAKKKEEPEEKEEQPEEEPEKEEQQEEKEEGGDVTLDDISGLLTGGM